MGFWWRFQLAWMMTKAFFRRGPHPLEHQQAVFLGAIERIAEQQTRQLEAVSTALVAQSAAFRAYLDMFKTPDGENRTYVMDDRAQLELEYERLRKSGYPVEADAEGQLQWVLDQTRR